jgi:cyclopropane fatty-acyl-phospholipid synthase-like methyltransferase
LAERYDFGSYRAVLDVGGGSGGASIGLVEACPTVHATIAELPSVVPIAQRFVAEAGLRDRIDIIASDVLHDSVPGPFDAAVVRNLLQVLSADEAQTALHNVGQSLRPGGAVYILAVILDDSRVSPATEALFNVVFLNFYDAGQAYTESEYRAWLVAAGFVDITREELSDGPPPHRAQRWVAMHHAPPRHALSHRVMDVGAVPDTVGIDRTHV